MQRSVIDVVIGIEEPLLGLGFSTAIEEAADMRVVAVEESRAALLDALKEASPRVAIVDVRFYCGDEDFLTLVREQSPGSALLVLVDHDEDECILRGITADPDTWTLSDEALEKAEECCLLALRNHAAGCCPRTASPAEVREIIRTVAQGRIAAADWMRARFVGRRREPSDPLEGSREITPRELEVMQLVAEGHPNKIIASRLGIHEQTVKNHLARIMDKLRVKNRVEVAVAVRARNLAR